MLIYYLPLSEFDAIVPREQKQAHSTLNKKNFATFFGHIFNDRERIGGNKLRQVRKNIALTLS